jgi:multiple sugar transport system permease protein
MKGKIKKLKNNNGLTAFLFLLPNFIGFTVFTLIPVIAAFALCFVKWDYSSPMEFVGFANFFRLQNDPYFFPSLKNTLFYTATSVPLTVIISLGLALLLYQKIKGVTIFRTIFFFPYIASMVACAVIWNLLYHPTMGPINAFLRFIGIQDPPLWTSSTFWVMPAIVIMGVWKQVGFYLIIFLAGLNNIPEQLYEAATIDGATNYQKFRYITMPMLTPVIFFVVVLLTIWSFKIFDQIQVMTQGGPGNSSFVLVYDIYYQAFTLFKFGYASAVAFVLFAIVLFFTVIQFILEKRWVNYQNS